MYSDVASSTYQKRFLKTQFRIQAPAGKNYTSEDYVNGIKYLLYKDTGLLSSKLTNYDSKFNRDVFRDRSIDAYFGYVTGKPMRQLFDWIEDDRNINPDHHNNNNNKFTTEEMVDPENQFEFTLYILNQYYVLLTRGIDGIRLGFWDNEDFRECMEKILGIL